MSAMKLFILLFIVCTGFAALGGHLNVPNPHNFDLSTSFQGTSKNGYNIGTALLDAIFSFQGYDNMNMAGTLALQGRPGFADQGYRFFPRSKTHKGLFGLRYLQLWVALQFSMF
jgi:hypothetical protein